MPRSQSSCANRRRSSARSIESGDVPRIFTPAACSASDSFSGVCPPNWTRHATSPPPVALALDHRHDVFERQRLEIQPVGRVVVGRHRFGVAVDHHRFEAGVAQRKRRVAAAVVELEALADPVRSAAENDDLRLVVRVRFVAPLVGAVHVRRERLELGRAGVDALECRDQLLFDAPLANRRFRHAVDGGDFAVAEPGALQRAQKIGRQLAQLLHARDAPQLGDLAELLEEPRIDVGQLVELLDVQPRSSALNSAHMRRSFGTTSFFRSDGVVFVVARLRQQQALLSELERSHALEERLLERAPDRHRLAHRLHLGGQRAIGLRKLLEVPPRNLRRRCSRWSARTTPGVSRVMSLGISSR